MTTNGMEIMKTLYSKHWLGVLAAAFPAVTLALFRFIRPTPVAVGAKLKPYECGVEPEGDTRGRYSVRFYIVAILFVIFDVETTFLFPWAVLFSTHEEGFRLAPVFALASAKKDFPVRRGVARNGSRGVRHSGRISHSTHD